MEAETSTTSRSAPRCTIWLEIGMWPSNTVPQPRPNDGLSNRQKIFSRPPYGIDWRKLKIRVVRTEWNVRFFKCLTCFSICRLKRILRQLDGAYSDSFFFRLGFWSMALRRALPRWDRHGQSTSSQEILASLKALLLCDYDVSQFSDLPSSHSYHSLNFRAKNVTKSLKISF